MTILQSSFSSFIENKSWFTELFPTTAKVIENDGHSSLKHIREEMIKVLDLVIMDDNKVNKQDLIIIYGFLVDVLKQRTAELHPLENILAKFKNISGFEEKYRKSYGSIKTYNFDDELLILQYFLKEELEEVIIFLFDILSNLILCSPNIFLNIFFNSY